MKIPIRCGEIFFFIKPKKIIRRSSIIVLDMGAKNILKPLFESILVHKYGWSG